MSKDKSIRICLNPLTRVRSLLNMKQNATSKIFGISRSGVTHREKEGNIGLATLVDSLVRLNVEATLEIEMPDGHKEKFPLTKLYKMNGVRNEATQ